ncbi:HK97-gp10 family putative phage morphogenesis protein [Clostridium neuense]|uniref:HK97-gp10 family putative phage morphogenesis protein n=1 Tax=Clostridium neuense TaxID=1728934 RepID=A0ABW8THX4_9CLOT
MEFKSNIPEVLNALEKAKGDICNTIGNFITAEAQTRATVLTGNMRRSITFEVHEDNNGVDIGVTPDAPYAIYVEKGTSHNKAQPFLEPAAMENISKLEEIAGQKISVNMGGK